MATPGGVSALSTADLYTAAVTMLLHAEDLRWARLNTILVVDSILLAAWAAIIAAAPEFNNRDIVLIALCLPGAVLGVPFSILGYRTSKYVDAYFAAAETIEKDELEPTSSKVAATRDDRKPQSAIEPPATHKEEERIKGPMLKAKRIRGQMGHGERMLTSSKSLVISIPLLFSLLFAVLIIWSFSNLSTQQPGGTGVLKKSGSLIWPVPDIQVYGAVRRRLSVGP
jgi:hypothetical protein